MFITESEIRRKIRALLTEGQRTDAFAGEISQVVVTAVASYCMRVFMRSTQGRKKSPPQKFELNFNFSKSASENVAINKVYNNEFLDNPQTPADKRRQSDYLNHPQINDLIKKMETLHKKHDGVKSRLESAIQKHATRSVSSNSIVAARMDEEIALQFSGRTKVIVNMDRANNGMDSFNFINSGRSFSGGAHIDQTTGDMQVELYLPYDFMDFSSSISTSQTTRLYRAFEIAKGHLKGAISHELTHTAQVSDFTTRRRSFQRQMRSGNSVAQYIDANAANYSPIDDIDNPLISSLYKHLGDTLKSMFAGGSGLMDIMMLRNGNHGNQNAQTDFTYFDLLIRHFAPEEIDAYVRGHRTDSIAQSKQGGRHSQNNRRDRLYLLFQDTVQQRVDGFLPPNKFHLPNRIASHLQTLDISYRDIRLEAVDAYLNRYEQLFGQAFTPQNTNIQNQPNKSIQQRTQAEKLVDAIDSQASLEFRTDPMFVNSIQYMKDELRKTPLDPNMFDQIKQMIRNAGYEIRTGSGKMGNRIFKRT